MRLSLRLMLLILGVVFSMLLAGAFVAVTSARQTVAEETESSARHTLQLLSAAIISSQTDNPQASQHILIQHLQELDQTRHLRIAVLRPDGTVIQPNFRNKKAGLDAVPHWFSSLIIPAQTEYRRRLGSPGMIPTEIVIVPDPTDEIREIWKETRNIVALILTFTALSLILIAWLIKRSMQPIKQISTGLEVIEAGNYQARLPTFSLPDLNSLSVRFNHMAEVLEAQQRENRSLSKRALDIAESERRHLARELHDELGQSISAIKAVAVSLMQQSDKEIRTARSIIDISDHIYSVVRDMMHRLRPVVLDELGLVVALERLVDDWNSHHENTFCILRIEGSLDGLSDTINIQLYRIVQEALTNIVKHAGASEANVQLTRSDKGDIRLSIRDNGKGFDPDIKHHGMGLPGLRERVNSMNGKLSLEARPGQGVFIQITIEDVTNEKNTSTSG